MFAIVAFNPTRPRGQRVLIHRGLASAEAAFLECWHGARVPASSWQQIGDSFIAGHEGRSYYVINDEDELVKEVADAADDDRISMEFKDINDGRAFLRANGLEIVGSKGWIGGGRLGSLTFNSESRKWAATCWKSEAA